MTDLTDNRFERVWRRYRSRWKNWAIGLVILVVIVEAGCEMALIAVDRRFPPEVLWRQYWLTRLAVSWWVPSTTIRTLERETRTKYRGTSGTAAHEDDVLLGWRNPASALIIRPRSPGEQAYGWLATDPQGFYVNSAEPRLVETPKPTNEYRVVMLGASTLQGYRPPESIPAQLEGLLTPRVARDKTLRVVNAGVFGYSSAQEFLYLVTEVANLEPDLVIVYDGANDQGASDKPLIHRPGGPALPLRLMRHEWYSTAIRESHTVLGALSFVVAAVRRWSSDCWGSTGIATIYRRLAEYASEQVERAKLYVIASPKLSDVIARWLGWRANLAYKWPYFPEVERGYAQNLAFITSFAVSRGVPVAVFLQPIMGVDGKPYAGGPEQDWISSRAGKAQAEARRLFYDAARKDLDLLAARYRGHAAVCVADLSRVFADRRESLYVDSVHVNGAGNTVIAREMASRLEQCGLPR